MEIWVQLLGALHIVPGGEMPLVARDLHRMVTEQVRTSRGRERRGAWGQAGLPGTGGVVVCQSNESMGR